MAQIYGELIRAQLQVSASDLTSPVVGLVYFNSSTGMKWHTGSAWKVAVDLDSTQELSGKTLNSTCSVDSSALSIVSLAKGGLGINAEGLVGVVKIASGATEASVATIVNSDVSATAAIDATKLADGSVDNTTFQKLFTVGTDAPGELVNTDGTQTLTNKTLDSSCSFDAGSLPIAPPSKGGTGVANNDLSTLTLSGDYPLTINLTGSTNVFLPEIGTLVTTDGDESLTKKLISTTEFLTGALQLPSGTTAEQPTGPAVIDGMIRYNTDLSAFEGRASGEWSPIGGGSAGGTVVTIPQVAHGLSVGNAVYLNGSTYTKAIATSAAAAEVVGVVSKADLPNEFDLTLSGELTGLTGLTTGEVYFLSPTTAGLLVTTEPTTIGQVSVPIGVASSATTMYVAPKRGSIVGGTNARAQVSLTSGAVTNVQNVGTMDAGELTGWVFISSAAPVRFYVSAKFAKSGAGGDYNLSYQTTGDTPPAGFLVDITTTGMIRVTLPASSGSTSVINYALNAPAIGASFPLTVNASQVQGRTDGSAVASGYVGEVIRPAAFNVDTSINSMSSTTQTDISGSSITLSKGVWILFYSCSAGIGGTFGANGGIRANIRITDAANILVPNSISLLIFGDGAISGWSTLFTQLSASTVVNIGTDTTYKLRAMVNTNGTVTGPAFTIIASGSGPGALSDPDSSSSFYAIRIA
jgi:hypothetical protein